MSPSHDDLRDLAAGYALDILEPSERERFEAHLATCPACADDVRKAAAVVDALAAAVPQHEPPVELRARVMSAAGNLEPRTPVRAAAPRESPRRLWWPVAASVLIALGAGIYGSHLHVEGRLVALTERAAAGEREITAAHRAAADARSAMAIIAAPDVQQMNLEGRGEAAGGRARVFWSRQRGVVFTASGLPALPSGRGYQLWFVGGAAPISLGTLPQSEDGSLAVFPGPAPTDVDGLAVTAEVLGGSRSPSGQPILTTNGPAAR